MRVVITRPPAPPTPLVAAAAAVAVGMLLARRLWRSRLVPQQICARLSTSALVDGIEYRQLDASYDPNELYDFSKFPQQMHVDWVRVYQAD